MSARSVAPSSDSACLYAILLPVGACEQLVQHRQRVTRRAAAGADHQREHRVVDGDAFVRADALEQAAHGLRGEQPERVVVGARPDGRQHLLGLGGGEDEDEVLRRLLDDLQERVEARGGHHVRFVDDEDAVPRLRRRVERPVAQLAGVVDAAVAGRVEFGDVDVAGTVGGQRDTGVTHAAGRRGGALLAVQRAREDARRRGLAAPAGAGEQVGMVDPARGQRRRQRFGDMLLADYFAERRRPVLAVESHDEQATQAW